MNNKTPNKPSLNFSTICFSADGNYRWAETLFDEIIDTVYFIKDTTGKYLSINHTFVKRCGLISKEDIIGSTVADVMPPAFGRQFYEQDEKVLTTKQSIKSKLELHLYADGQQDWCLTWKEPLFDEDGNIAGLCGISRDLQPNSSISSDYPNVSKMLEHIQNNLANNLRIRDLTQISQLSEYQLDKRIKSLFGLSLGQYITRQKIGLACHSLANSQTPINQIALDSGYSDQAAFSRQFKQSVGLTPIEYRKSFNLKQQN